MKTFEEFLTESRDDMHAKNAVAHAHEAMHHAAAGNKEQAMHHAKKARDNLSHATKTNSVIKKTTAVTDHVVSKMKDKGITTHHREVLQHLHHTFA